MASSRPWAVGVEHKPTGVFNIHQRFATKERAEEIAGWEATERAGVEVRYLPVPQKRQFDEQLIASEAARILSDAEAFGWLDHRYAEQMHAQIQVLVAMVRAESRA